MQSELRRPATQGSNVRAMISLAVLSGNFSHRKKGGFPFSGVPLIRHRKRKNHPPAGKDIAASSETMSESLGFFMNPETSREPNFESAFSLRSVRAIIQL